MLTPTALWLLAVASDEAVVSPLLAMLLGPVLFFGSFGYLLRTQFARRRRFSDVSASWLLAEFLGLLLVAGVLLVLWASGA